MSKAGLLFTHHSSLLIQSIHVNSSSFDLSVERFAFFWFSVAAEAVEQEAAERLKHLLDERDDGRGAPLGEQRVEGAAELFGECLVRLPQSARDGLAVRRP